MSMWRSRKYIYTVTFAAFLICAFRQYVKAYTTVIISTAAPKGLETQFLASTTNQYLAKITSNPLAENTYTLKLFDYNLSFNPEPTNKDLLNSIVTISSYTYAYGWADGESYNQSALIKLSTGYLINCSSPIAAFNLVRTSTATFDTETCYDVMQTLINAIYNMSLSTPTVVPGF